MIECKPKLPAECIDYTKDVRDNEDYSPEEIEMLREGITLENIHRLTGIHDDVFDQGKANIHKAQQCQKKNYDMRNATGETIKVGDIVLKEKMKAEKVAD